MDPGNFKHALECDFKYTDYCCYCPVISNL